MARKDESTPKVAPVDDYPERPYEEAKADPDDLLAAEAQGPDQIVNYHKDNPTLGDSKADEYEVVTEIVEVKK